MGRTRKLLPAKAGKRLRSLEYEYEIEVFIKIGLRSRATAPGPICSASGSLIRALHRVCRKHRARESLHYVSGLPVPSLNRVRCGGIPSRWEGPVSCYLPKQVRDCGAWNMNMKSRSLLKSGSGVAPPRPARPAARPPDCSPLYGEIPSLNSVRPL